MSHETIPYTTDILSDSADRHGAFGGHDHTFSAALGPLSGSDQVYYIRSLLLGFTWTGTVNTAATVNYSFDGTFFGGSFMSTLQQQAVLASIQLIENVANITFQESSDLNDADIYFSQDELGSGILGLTTWNVSGSRFSVAEVYIDDDETGYSPGGSGFYTAMHEIGHSIGLEHPHEEIILPVGEDNSDNTVMSYNPGDFTTSIFPETPMIYDVATLQYLYGANTNYNADDTTYNYDGSDNSVSTLWDGGGTDKIDASSYTGNSSIDIGEGINNISQIGSTIFWSAFGSNIENVTAGTGNDTIAGNDLANNLVAGAGDDSTTGGGGNDFLGGNSGNDTLAGGSGTDSVRGGKGDDLLRGNQGQDVVFGDIGNDTMFGGKDSDDIRGNQGDDQLFGDNGSDTLFGGKGNDILSGGDGADQVSGDLGDDALIGGDGADIFIFNDNTGSDIINDFDTSIDTIQITTDVFASSQAVLNALTFDSGNATLSLGNGATITLLGVSSGVLSVDDFTIL